MSDIVIGGWSDTWRTDLGYASMRSPDIRPPPQTISYLYQKLLEIEKEIVREVARGDKPYRSQSTNQFAELNERLPDLCFAIGIRKFSHVRFITPSHLTHNLFFSISNSFWYEFDSFVYLPVYVRVWLSSRLSWRLFEMFDVLGGHFKYSTVSVIFPLASLLPSCFSSFLSVLALGPTVILRLYSCLDLGPETGRLQHA